MSLSLKAELDIWSAALKAYDEQDFEQALELFSRIADSSKILTNVGLIYATIGQHEAAVDHFVAATNLDAYLAIAHFQCGVSNFLLQRYDLALLNFEDAYLYLRGNESINYDQLGLKFKLFSAEIMFNRGLAHLHLGYAEQGMADMQEASRQKVTDEHGVIDEAIRDHGEGYTVFSIPVGVLYRPSENKLKNSKSKDYLGKAKLVAASDSSDAFTEFTGVVKRQQASGGTDIKEGGNKNKPDAELSVLGRSASAPAPRIDPVVPRPIVHERSKTTVQVGIGVRPDAAAILASRRAQSVSNPENVPSNIASDASRSNIVLGSSNSTRLARSVTTNTGTMPLRPKTPLVTDSGISGIGANGSRAGGEAGALAGGTLPAIRRLKTPRTTAVPQQSTLPPARPAVQLGQYMNAGQTVVLPAVPDSVQEERHLTQFYNAYMEVYTDNQALRSAIPRPPIAQMQSSASLSQRRSPGSIYQQPQPQRQEQQQLPAWTQSSPSPGRASSNASPAISRAPSRAANANSSMSSGMNQIVEPVVSMNPSMGAGTATASKGGISNAGGGSHRRKQARRPKPYKTTMYDDEDGDDGFVAGEYEELEMANIRIKLHYQGDVRGMTIPPTTSFDEFVERVTTKFGTSMTGLGMKFTDEDGTKISLRDESDFELAIETARESAKGRSEGKIEVWCVDV